MPLQKRKDSTIPSSSSGTESKQGDLVKSIGADIRAQWAKRFLPVKQGRKR